MKYRIYDKPDKIILHGGPGAIGSVSHLAKSLGGIELLNYGKTIEAQLKEIKDVVDEFDLKELILIGHSWGAWLAYMYACQYPVSKIILIGCGSFKEDYLSDMNQTRMNRLTKDEQDHVGIFFDQLGKGQPLSDKDLFGKLMAKMDSYDPIDYEDESLFFDMEGHQSLMDEFRPLRQSGRILDMGKKITAELVVIHGQADPHSFNGVIEPLEAIGLKPRAYYLEKCGHTPWLEKANAEFFKVMACETRYLFESERLGFRHFNLSDEATFLVMNSEKKVMKYFPGKLDEKSSRAFLERIIDRYQMGYGLYAVEIKESAEFIGFIGLSSPRFEMDFTPCVEIGWRLMNHHWRKGYAKEGAKRVLDYAFNHLNLKEIVSFTSENNTPSIGVMKSIGMTYSRDFDHPMVEGHLKKHVLYKISK